MKLKILTIAFFYILTFPGIVISDEGKNIGIEISPSSSSEVDNLSATAFGISLASWVSSNEKIELLPSGYYIPTFEGLVSAFGSQIQIWRELKDKQDPNSTYMNNLILVDDNDYLKEYVWTHHSEETKSEKPSGLRLVEFQKWEKDNLSGHTPRIEAKVNIKK